MPAIFPAGMIYYRVQANALDGYAGRARRLDLAHNETKPFRTLVVLDSGFGNEYRLSESFVPFAEDFAGRAKEGASSFDTSSVGISPLRVKVVVEAKNVYEFRRASQLRI
jgi:hypothetical protein